MRGGFVTVFDCAIVTVLSLIHGKGTQARSHKLGPASPEKEPETKKPIIPTTHHHSTHLYFFCTRGIGLYVSSKSVGLLLTESEPLCAIQM